MNQDDFRQMLASRVPAGDAHGYGGKRNLTEADLAEVRKLSAKKAKKKGKKPKNAAPAAGDDAAELRAPKSSYRDRAAERRRGDTGDMIDADEYKHLNTEQSKFLGGDMEHTHLVKGLDFALLAQLKREKQKLLAEKEKQVQDGAGEVQTMRPRDGKLTFKSRMGRLVYFHACQSTPEATTLAKSELFLPGRMYYTFNLSTTEVETVPVSVQRSKDDCPEPDEVVSGIVDETLVDRVKELMSSKRSGKKMRKKKKEGDPHHAEVANAADADVPMEEVAVEAPAVDDDDEDIFPDVGEYVPIDQRTDDESTDARRKDSIKKAGYFSNLSASITEKEETARRKEEEAERAWKETLQKAVDAQKRIEREKERKAKEAKMTGEADDYAEYQAVGALPESDDEDDEETARRRKAAGLTDRKSEVDPEEKVRRKKQKQSSKLANDLEKINKIMEDKSKT
ncbi:Transmembrane protein [Phytophthora cinnamomi]|uniref:Transmembrane protein n=1 Tax=Phytophthora cinnamomi TaxID=4785 RepID=UPI00355A6A48|nr:Transmembrane protein [Phytophthora cinnamomi]